MNRKKASAVSEPDRLTGALVLTIIILLVAIVWNKHEAIGSWLGFESTEEEVIPLEQELPPLVPEIAVPELEIPESLGVTLDQSLDLFIINDPETIAASREENEAFDSYLNKLEEGMPQTNATDEHGYPIAQTCEVHVPQHTTKVFAWADERGCDIRVIPYLNESQYCSSLINQCVKVVI